MGKFKLFFLLLILLARPAFAARTEAEWVKAREEMCAVSSEASAKEKIEAQAECPECIGKLPLSTNAVEALTQSKKILEATQRNREIIFLREWTTKVEMSLDVAKSILIVYEDILNFMQIGVFSPEEKALQEEWNKAIGALATEKDDPSSEQKDKLIKLSSDLDLVLGNKIQAQEKFQYADANNTGAKGYIDVATKTFQKAREGLERIRIYLSDTKLPFKKIEILNYVSAVMTPYHMGSPATMNAVQSQLKLAKLKIAKPDPQSSPKKDFSGSEDELKQLEDQIWEEVKIYNFPRNLCGMSVAEIVSIMKYTGSGYSSLNSALRDTGVNGLPEAVKAFRDILKSALRKLKAYEGEVKRGADLPMDVVAQHSPGEILTYPAFTSTSLESGFSGSQQFIIKSKHGRFIAPLSAAPAEEEVLFDAGTKFKVLSKELKDPIEDSDSDAVQDFKKRNVRIILEEVE